MLDESIYTAVPTLLACGRKSSGKATVLIAFPVGTAALCQKVIITTLLIRTDWPLVMPYADRSSSPQAILVLNTLRKMYKTEFCLNNYTNGRNTKIIKAPDYKNYKSVSLPFTAPNDGYICGGVYSLGTTACYIYVNSTQVGWNHSGGGSNTASPFMYPLSKGDIVTAIGYDQFRAYFIYTK